MTKEPRILDVAIVGGGLAGSLAACALTRRGHRVRVYEYRSDIRVEESRGQSIDLALSIRGREALRLVDLEDTLVNHHGIAMRGRMLHGRDGKLSEMIYDRIGNNCIYSVSRKYMNQVLLNAADEYPCVDLHFNKKLLDADLDNGKLKFLDTNSREIIDVEAELIIGADGAYSSVRKTMMKRAGFDFSQTYIEHGYVELAIPAKFIDERRPEIGQEFAMSNKHLHIWPRGNFMLIALPNDDFSFTGNLFAPLEILNGLDTPEKLVKFFSDEFPDAISLIGGEQELVKNFFVTKPKTLISIKCSPYNAGSKALILGDAAHAMVPFYAQGMNAAFEDVLLLDGLMEKYDSDPEKVLPAFSKLRCEDAHAICDLAMYNYIEMRDLVTRKSFMIRRGLDTLLHAIWPTGWVPLYNTVHFSRMGFRDCIANRAWQDKCSPYNAGSKALILGDAAHAMVPFYAQGMNAAFEDVLLLDGLMEKYDSDPEKVLPAFSKLRCKDAHAICDLAMYNYIEMRDLVTRKSFMIRRGLDTLLHAIWPSGWVPLYNTVHFSRMGFRDCIANRAWQDKMIRRSFWCLGTAASLGVLLMTKISIGTMEN